MAHEDCPVCALAQNPDEGVVFMNEDVMIVAPNPALAFGHIQIFPRKHYAIFEHMSHDDVGTLFSTASAMASVLFDLLRAQGTNIIMQNGISAGQAVAHVSIHIIPRRENDDIDLMWELAPANQQELQQTAAQLKDAFVPVKVALEGGEKKPISMERKVERIGAKPEKRSRAPENQGDSDAPEESAQENPPLSRRKKEERVNYLLKQLDRLP